MLFLTQEITCATRGIGVIIASLGMLTRNVLQLLSEMPCCMYNRCKDMAGCNVFMGINFVWVIS